MLIRNAPVYTHGVKTSSVLPALRVLLVEDSPLVQSHLVDLVESVPGLELIATAETAWGAIASTRHLEPDVVILDVLLRAGSALDVLRAITVGGSRCAVIVYTDDDTDLFRCYCCTAGVDWFLSRPRDASRLEALLRCIGRDGVEACEDTHGLIGR